MINDQETSILTSEADLSICLRTKTCGFASVAAENMSVKLSARCNHILQHCPNKTGPVSDGEELRRNRQEMGVRGGGAGGGREAGGAACGSSFCLLFT